MQLFSKALPPSGLELISIEPMPLLSADLFFDAEGVGSILHTIHHFHAVPGGGILDDQRALIVRPPLLAKLVAPEEI